MNAAVVTKAVVTKAVVTKAVVTKFRKQTGVTCEVVYNACPRTEWVTCHRL